MRKYYTYEVKKKIQIVVRNSLDPDPKQDPNPGSDFWLDPDPDSMNMDPKHWFTYSLNQAFIYSS